MSDRHASRPSRVGKLIGTWISIAANIAAGYVWAEYGLLWGIAVLGGTILVALAGWGALNFPWKQHA